MTRTPRSSNEGGFAILAILLIIVVLTAIAGLTQLTSRTELRIGANTYANSQAYYAAEAGVEKLLAEMRNQMAGGFLTQKKVDTASLQPPKISGYTFSTYTAELDTTVTIQSITQGPFAGLTSMDQPLRVTASVVSETGARSTVEVSAKTQAIPVFQFQVFYDKDLEIFPGPLMNLHGRVHSNGDLYVDGNTGLYLWDMVTSAGDLHLHRKDSGGGSDGLKNFIAQADSSWVEFVKDTHSFGGDDNPATVPSNADDKAFDDYSTTTWGHQIQTRASGIVPMRLPIPDGMDPYSIIQPCTGTEDPSLGLVRYGCKANLIVRVNGTALKITNGAGTTKVLMDPLAVRFVTNAFYDDREQSSSAGTALNADNTNSNRDVVEIDVSRLTQAEYGNGIVYVTADSLPVGLPLAPKDARQYVVRVRNGSLLLDPLTIATNLPMYVMGDYNSDDASWQPASLVSDAITILSGAWDDAKSGEGLTEKMPTDVKVQTAIMSGHTATPFMGSPDAGGQYENFPRFLEDWSKPNTVTLNGSMISLWTARVTPSKWQCCNYYVPPIRDWNFDDRFMDPDQLPPATPVVGQLLRVGFVRRY